jgi:hypothetical protein
MCTSASDQDLYMHYIRSRLVHALHVVIPTPGTACGFSQLNARTVESCMPERWTRETTELFESREPNIPHHIAVLSKFGDKKQSTASSRTAEGLKFRAQHIQVLPSAIDS